MRKSFRLAATALALLFLLPGRAHAQSAPPRAPSAPAQTPCPPAPEKFALLVGVGDYQHVKKLTAPVQDAADVRDLLINKFCFPAGNIKVLPEKEATRDGIIAAFKSHLIANAKKTKNAIAVFYYSGHGSNVNDEPNGDEGNDHLDETLVTINSHGRDDTENFSLTDDELYELSNELSDHTDNITFIIDSCNSGTVMRGPEQGVEIKRVLTDKRKEAVRVGGKKPRAARDERDADLLPRNKSYVLITAARSDEIAWGRVGDSRNSLMTHHLLRILERAAPETSYWQLWEELQRGVSLTNQNQHPQIEGDLRRSLFAGSASREDVFLKARATGGKEVVINAGAAQGIRVGTLVALYRPEAKRIAERDKQIGTATVNNVEGLLSTATLDKDFNVPDGARAAVISPSFGGERVRVAFDLGPTERLTAADRATLAEIKRRVGMSRVLEPAESAAGATATQPSRTPLWHVAVLRGKFGELFRNTEDENVLAPPEEPVCPIPAADADVFYIATEVGKPLYGFFVQPHCDERESKIESALKKFADQQNLRALKNDSWPGGSAVKLTVKRAFGVYEPNGHFKKLRVEEAKPGDGRLAHRFDQEEELSFEVTNLWNKELYVTVIALMSNGAIEILYPLGSNVPVKKSETIVLEDATGEIYQTSAPPGIETIKVIATTTPADFSFLETGGATRGKGSGKDGKTISAVGWLMGRAMSKEQQDATLVQPGLDTWTTAEIQLEISDRKKN